MNVNMATHVLLMDDGACINAHSAPTQGIACYLPLADSAAQLLEHLVPAALHCKPQPALEQDNRPAYAIKHHDSSFAGAFAIFTSWFRASHAMYCHDPQTPAQAQPSSQDRGQVMQMGDGRSALLALCSCCFSGSVQEGTIQLLSVLLCCLMQH